MSVEAIKRGARVVFEETRWALGRVVRKLREPKTATHFIREIQVQGVDDRPRYSWPDAVEFRVFIDGLEKLLYAFNPRLSFHWQSAPGADLTLSRGSRVTWELSPATATAVTFVVEPTRDPR